MIGKQYLFHRRSRCCFFEFMLGNETLALTGRLGDHLERIEEVWGRLESVEGSYNMRFCHLSFKIKERSGPDLVLSDLF